MGEPWGRFGRSGCVRRDSEETREALRRLGGSEGRSGGGLRGRPGGRLQVPFPSRAGCCLPTPVTVATSRAPPAPHRRCRCRRSCWAAACRHQTWSYWPRPSAPPAPSTRRARRDSSAGEGGAEGGGAGGRRGRSPAAALRTPPPLRRVPAVAEETPAPGTAAAPPAHPMTADSWRNLIEHIGKEPCPPRDVRPPLRPHTTSPLLPLPARTAAQQPLEVPLSPAGLHLPAP